MPFFVGRHDVSIAAYFWAVSDGYQFVVEHVFERLWNLLDALFEV